MKPKVITHICSLAVLLIISLAPAYAKQMTLQCTTDSGNRTTINIDTEKKKVTLGPLTYDIYFVDETWVSAYLQPYKQDGEVIIINRLTGDYKRASAGLVYHDPDLTKPNFETHTYSGHCNAPVF